MNDDNTQRLMALLDENERALAQVSFDLYQRELKLDSHLTDYSFIVFDIAKAYEGFLKRYLFELNLIDRGTYESKRFRLGRALNPDVRYDQRDRYWLYDDVARLCGQAVARQLWKSWLESRNRVFHYFPRESATMTLQQAGQHLSELAQTIEAAMLCQNVQHYFEPRRSVSYNSGHSPA